MLSKRGDPAISTVSTLIVLTSVVLVGWALISFTRVGLARSEEPKPALVSISAPDAQPVSLTQTSTEGSTVLAKRETMVYVVAGDATYYHCPMHGMHNGARQAVALSTARARGLAPCPVCFKVVQK